MNALGHVTAESLDTPPEAAHGAIACWLNGCSAARNVPQLRPDHFSNDQDGAAWAAILDLEAAGVIGDQGALLGRLKGSPFFAGGNVTAYWRMLMELTERADDYSMREHGGRVYEFWRRRQLELKAARDRARARDLSMPLPADENTTVRGARNPKRWNVDELLEAKFESPRGPWPGVIPAGLTIIAARPKYGKSMLMLQVGAAVASGGMLFDQELEQRPVLYYALEDSEQRLQERVGRLRLPKGTQLAIDRSLTPLFNGGLEQVLSAMSEFGMLVIDTISRAMPGKDFIKDGALFGDVLGRLQAAALDKNCAVVAVVHTRKPNGMNSDPVDDVMGTTHMTAAADCVLAIYREHGRSTLKGRARDMGDIDLTLEFDPVTVAWQLLGKTEKVQQTESEAEILDALRELGRANTTSLAKSIGMQRSHTSARLQKLMASGLVCRQVEDGVIYYYLAQPGQPAEG